MYNNAVDLRGMLFVGVGVGGRALVELLPARNGYLGDGSGLGDYSR